MINFHHPPTPCGVVNLDPANFCHHVVVQSLPSLLNIMHAPRVVLPYDVWLYIASFIPSSALAKLYSVNSAFFHHAMKIRYGEVRIASVTQPGTVQCYLHMRYAIPQIVCVYIVT